MDDLTRHSRARFASKGGAAASHLHYRYAQEVAHAVTPLEAVSLPSLPDAGVLITPEVVGLPMSSKLSGLPGDMPGR